MDARPCPTISRSGSTRPVGAMPAATRAERSDSIAARAATESAGPSKVGRIEVSMLGREGAGKEWGRAPIRETSRLKISVTTVASTTAISAPGRLPGNRRHASVTAMTPNTSPRASPA